jgi:hypothetical protein
MATSDQTLVMQRCFQQLRALADKLPKTYSPRGSYVLESRSFLNWLREVRETVQVFLGADCYVVGELSRLIEETDREELQDDNESLQEARELIDTAGRIAALKSDNTISAELQHAIELSIKQGYFSSWPVKVMLSAATVLLAVLFGGTVYSTFQVDGVRKQAEQASHDMAEKLTTFNKQAVDANEQLQGRIEKVNSQIEEAVRKAAAGKLSEFEMFVGEERKKIEIVAKATTDAITTEQNSQISAFKNAASSLVDSTKTKLDEYLRHALEDTRSSVESGEASAKKATDDKRDEAIKALDSSRTEAVKILEEQRKNAVIAVDGAQTAATSSITSQAASANSARNTAETKINQAVDTVDASAKSATDAIGKVINTIPERIQKIGESVVALDVLLKKYENPVTDIVARLQTNKPQSTLDAIADVLGWSTLLISIVIATSIIALALSLTALFVRARRKPPVVARPA